MSAPHVQRCSVTQRFGVGAHANWWQCRHTDPHPGGPDQPHDFGLDAEVFGRDLNIQRPEWLAATLRDVAARQRHLERRLDEMTAHAVRLARLAGELDLPRDVPADTRRWVSDNAPVAAFTLGWTDVNGKLR